MKAKILCAVALLLGSSTPLLAQEERVPGVFRASRKTGAAADASNSWIRAEYLGWWITKGPLGIPVVTTGSPVSGTTGVIGDPSTRVLLGNSDVDFGLYQGGRISAGRWFGCDAPFGLEASGYYLPRRSQTFSFASDAAGSPLLAIPFQNPDGTESRLLISSPAPVQTGAVVATLTSEMWGAELNGLFNLYRDCNFSFDLLAGFRYDQLTEEVRLDGQTRLAFPTPINDTFPTIALSFFDSFNVRNQFYGGQVGARTSFRAGRWSADVIGKIAVGTTVHTLTVEGGSTLAITPPTFAVPAPAGGVFAKPSNIGTFRNNSFTYLPHLQLQVGYDLTDHIRLIVGYEALYWSNVNRPGNQIDRIIGPQPGTRPMPLNNQSSLFAHGFKGGIEVRW